MIRAITPQGSDGLVDQWLMTRERTGMAQRDLYVAVDVEEGGSGGTIRVVARRVRYHQPVIIQFPNIVASCIIPLVPFASSIDIACMDCLLILMSISSSIAHAILDSHPARHSLSHDV